MSNDKTLGDCKKPALLVRVGQLESQLAAALHENAMLNGETAGLTIRLQQVGREVEGLSAVNHELAESLFVMSEKYQGLASEVERLEAERNELKKDLKDFADTYRECFGYQESEPIDLPTFLIQDVYELKCENLALSQQRDAAGEAVKVAGAIICNSVDGVYRVTVWFDNLENAQALHKLLVETKHTATSATPAHERQDDNG